MVGIYRKDNDLSVGRNMSFSGKPMPGGRAHTVNTPQTHAPSTPDKAVTLRTAGPKAPTAPVGSNPQNMSVMAQAARMHDGVKAQYGADDQSAQAQLSRMTAQPVATQQPQTVRGFQTPQTDRQWGQVDGHRGQVTPVGGVQPIQPPPVPQQQQGTQLAQLMNQMHQQGKDPRFAFESQVSTDLPGALGEIDDMYRLY